MGCSPVGCCYVLLSAQETASSDIREWSHIVAGGHAALEAAAAAPAISVASGPAGAAREADAASLGGGPARFPVSNVQLVDDPTGEFGDILASCVCIPF